MSLQGGGRGEQISEFCITGRQRGLRASSVLAILLFFSEQSHLEVTLLVRTFFTHVHSLFLLIPLRKVNITS